MVASNYLRLPGVSAEFLCSPFPPGSVYKLSETGHYGCFKICPWMRCPVARTWGALLSAWQAESQPSAKSRSKWASNSASATNTRFLPSQASPLLTKTPPWKDLRAPGEGCVSWGVCVVVGCAARGLSALPAWPFPPCSPCSSVLPTCGSITEPNPFPPLLLKYREPQPAFLKSCQLANQLSQTISMPMGKNQKKT